MNTFAYIYLLFSLSFFFCEGKVKDKDERIIGGGYTTIERFPYQVSLQILYQVSGLTYAAHICGGSIISSYWVLTAAHCFDNYRYKLNQALYDFTVNAGTTNNNDYTNQQRRTISGISIHPKYIHNPPDPPDYDAALLKVGAPFAWNTKVSYVFLTNIEPSPGNLFTVSGWGRYTTLNNDTSIALKTTNLYVKSRTDCTRAWQTYKVPFTTRMICASSPGTDTCQGDSGGGGIIYDSYYRKYLAGIVSWGYKTCASGVPSVYTNVANYEIRNWITTTTGV